MSSTKEKPSTTASRQSARLLGMDPEYGAYEKPPRSRKTKENADAAIIEVIDSPEDVNPYEVPEMGGSILTDEAIRAGNRDPEHDPDVSPLSMIPPKIQAVESPPTDMKLDGSTPPDNSDEENPFVTSVETNDDDVTDNSPSVSYEDKRTDDQPHHHMIQSNQTEPIIELPADGPSGPGYLIIREMEKFMKEATNYSVSTMQRDYNQFELEVRTIQARQFEILRNELTAQRERLRLETDARIFASEIIKQDESRERDRIRVFYGYMEHLKLQFEEQVMIRVSAASEEIRVRMSESISEIRERIRQEFLAYPEFQAAVQDAVMANRRTYQDQLGLRTREVKELKGLQTQSELKIRLLEEDVAIYTTDLTHLENELSQLKSEYESQGTELSNDESELRKIRSEHAQLISEKSFADAELRDFETAHRSLIRSTETDNQQIRSVNNALEEERTELTTSLERMQLEMTKLQTDNNEIRSMNKVLEEERIELVTSLERMQLELRDVTTRRQTDSLLLESVEIENADLVKQVATHRTSAADLVKKIGDIQSEIKSKQRVIRSFETLKQVRERTELNGCLECPRLKKLITEEQQAKEDALSRVVGLQAALDREIDLSQEARALSESELEEVRTDRDERISQFERLLAEQLKDQKDATFTQWHREKSEFLEDESAKKRIALEETSVQLQKAETVRIELNEAERAIANLETAIEIREESITKLTGQLEKSRTDHQAFESAHQYAQNTIASLQSVVDSLKFGRSDRLRNSEKLLEQAQAGYVKNPKNPSVHGLDFMGLHRTDATASLSTKSHGSAGYPVRQFATEPTIAYIGQTQTIPPGTRTQPLSQPDQTPPNPSRRYTDQKDPLRNNFGRSPFGDDGGDGGDDGDPNGSNTGSDHGSMRSVRGFSGTRRGPSFSELLKFVPKLASTAEKTHIKLFLATVEDIRIQYGVTDLEILRIVNLRLMETTHPKISKWWADEASLTPFRSWAQARKSLSERFAETIDNSLVEEYAMDGVQKATESLREFAERMSFALTHCRIPDDIANGEVPPATIRDCITFLQKRDINVDSKPNGPDLRSALHGGSRSVRGRSLSRSDTDDTLESRIMNKIPQVVAMALQQSRSDPLSQPSNQTPNGSPPPTIPAPKIRTDVDQKIQDSDQVVCDRCGYSGHPRDQCSWQRLTCYRCNQYGHHSRECGLAVARREGGRGSYSGRGGRGGGRGGVTTSSSAPQENGPSSYGTN
ncbi:hypothetical protein AC1031_018622 [Aphanomyces cochlioides]|nr:hypothetical protein AC1031_018622 [Aphanomyces cochlioides]